MVRPGLRAALLALAAGAAALAGPGQAGPILARFEDIQDEDRVRLAGDQDARALGAPQLGAADPDRLMGRMLLSLRMAPEAQARLEALLAAQQDPASPEYHHWLTPEAFAARFAPSPQQRRIVEQWLERQGFQVDQVSPGGLSITFSGRVGQVQRAFRTPIREVLLEGRRHLANLEAPSLPRALAGVVHGVVSLHDLPVPHAPAALPAAGPWPAINFAGGHYLVPGDLARIYNVTPLYAAGCDGTGQNLAVVGRCNVNLADVRQFRSTLGLPARDPVVILNGGDPGNLGGSEELEANLDVQWAGAVARNATLKFVVSPSGASDGVYLSAQYVVDHQVAPVMSVSFGLCESLLGTSGNAWINNLYAQAAAQGITVVVASGDYGSSGCYPNGTAPAVSGLASTPYNVCVGGTQFNEGTGTYWSATNNADSSSALGYLPEIVWNQGSAGTGGGVSSVYPKPAWQVAPGVPADGHRDVPDLSLSASSHDGYLIYIAGRGGWQPIAGTSASAPAFAGLVALLNQRTGVAQGNLLPTLYRLGAQQYGGGTAVFHDITAGTNALFAAGYAAGPGYDCATGLGSVDAAALAGSFLAVTLAPDLASPQRPGPGVAFRAAVAATGTYEYQFWLQAPGGAWTSVQAYGSTAAWTWATAGLAPGTYNVRVWVRAAGTAPAAGYTAAASLAYTLSPAPVTVSLGCSAASPQAAGSTLTLTATAAGGSGSFLYQFWTQAPGGAWVVAQPYGSSRTYAWPTGALAGGVYNLGVWVKQAGTSPAAGYDANANSSFTLVAPQVALAMDKAAPQAPGATVTFTATGSGGSGSYLYQFWTQAPGGAWVAAGAYGSSRTFAWATAGKAPGTYRISVWMKNAGTSPAAGYAAATSVGYALAYPAVSCALAASPASPQGAGVPVVLTASASGGSGRFEYQIWAQPPGGAWSVVRAYGTSPGFTWATGSLAAGTWNLAVWVRNAGTAPAAGYDATASLAFTLAAPRVALAVDKASPQPAGTLVTATATGSGGSGSYQYEFWVQAPGGAWTVVQGWSATRTFAWSTAGKPPGTYGLSVWMRNAGAAPAAGYNAATSLTFALR